MGQNARPVAEGCDQNIEVGKVQCMHLFTGGVVFESLLKHFYPNKENGSRTETLRDVFNTISFSNEFGRGFETRASSI